MALVPSRDWPNPEARHIACNVSRDTVTAFHLGPRSSPRGRLRRSEGALRPLGLATAPAAASRSVAASPQRRRLTLMACARSLWSSARCFLSGLWAGSGRCRATLATPLRAAPRWRSWRRLGRAAALAVAWRSAAALPRRPLALSAQCVALGGSLSLCVVVGGVASSLGAVAVARRLRRRAALAAPLPATPRWRT